MALASYLSVLKVTAQATEKGMDTATKPQLLFKWSWLFFFFYLLFRDWIFVFYVYGRLC